MRRICSSCAPYGSSIPEEGILEMKPPELLPPSLLRLSKVHALDHYRV